MFAPWCSEIRRSESAVGSIGSDTLCLNSVEFGAAAGPDLLTGWGAQVSFDRDRGLEHLGAYLETGSGMRFRPGTGERSRTGDRRVLTWLAREVLDSSHPRSLESAGSDLPVSSSEMQIYGEKVGVRRVVPETLNEISDVSPETMIVMRRYTIQGDWDEFLSLWREVAELREEHGFHVLFAVGDRDLRRFTWAFTTRETDFQEFLSQGQRQYYDDPRRIELETINAYLQEITLTPSRLLLVH